MSSACWSHHSTSISCRLKGCGGWQKHSAHGDDGYQCVFQVFSWWKSVSLEALDPLSPVRGWPSFLASVCALSCMASCSVRLALLWRYSERSVATPITILSLISSTLRKIILIIYVYEVLFLTGTGITLQFLTTFTMTEYTSATDTPSCAYTTLSHTHAHTHTHTHTHTHSSQNPPYSYISWLIYVDLVWRSQWSLSLESSAEPGSIDSHRFPGARHHWFSRRQASLILCWQTTLSLHWLSGWQECHEHNCPWHTKNKNKMLTCSFSVLVASSQVTWYLWKHWHHFLRLVWPSKNFSRGGLLICQWTSPLLCIVMGWLEHHCHHVVLLAGSVMQSE